MALEGPQPATAGIISACVELADSVFRRGQGPSMRDKYPLSYAEENAENIRIFTDGGRPVAMAAMCEREAVILGTRHRFGCIGSVCTDPAYRGGGLASRLLLDARAKAVRDGCDMMLISGGRSLYRRQGYVDAGGYVVYRAEPDQLPEGGQWTVRAWRPEDVDALTGIHAGEPVRLVRTPQQFRALLETGLAGLLRATTHVVCRSDGEPVAYAVCQRPGDRGRNEGVLPVYEMAGARWALAHVLGRLLAEHGVAQAALRCLACDAEVRSLADGFGWAAEPQGFQGTTGIIAPRRFWEASAPLLAERLGTVFGRIGFDASGERVTIRLGDEHLVLAGMSDFTRLVFLPRGRGPASALPDGSALACALRAMFPMPHVDYGLDYV